jgi:hypothetical protein
VCAQQLEVTMKRHRGQPLPLEKKLQIVGDLLQQRKEREALMASRAATHDDTSDRHRASLFGRSVDSNNSIIVSIVNSKKNKTVAHNQKERRQTKGTTNDSQDFAPHSVDGYSMWGNQQKRNTGAYISNVIS